MRKKVRVWFLFRLCLNCSGIVPTYKEAGFLSDLKISPPQLAWLNLRRYLLRDKTSIRTQLLLHSKKKMERKEKTRYHFLRSRVRAIEEEEEKRKSRTKEG